MTAQFEEKLRYEGKDESMLTNPLCDYFAMGGVDPRFKWNCTALLRGYVGRWEIIDGRLYLVELHGTLENGDEASVATIFPDFPDRVFAHWYSGTIRIPQGELLEYIHLGYLSTFERDLLLHLERGVVKHTRVRHNGTANSEHTPESHEVGAMTVFPRAKKDNGEVS
jgi:hypothetical protein